MIYFPSFSEEQGIGSRYQNKVDIPIREQAACENLYRDHAYVRVSDNEVCVGTEGKDACYVSITIFHLDISLL